jgi:cytochrome c553
VKRKTVLFIVTLFLMTAVLASAQDSAALYKSKCAGCHGANGQGKPAMKAPALKGTSWEETKIADHITKGEPESKPPHKKGISGLSDDQAKAIAQYVKGLK